MIKTGPLAATLLAALLLPAVTACVKKPPMMPLIRPLAADPAAQPSSAEEASLTLFGTLDLGLRHLDPDTRARYLKEVAGQTEDPFLPGAPGQEEFFLVFLFTVDNRGAEPVLISPSFASLMDRKGRFNIGPFDIRELSGIMAANPAFTPEVSRRFHQATINVNPGERHAKLLVFPAMDSKTDMVEVVIPSVVAGHVSADAHFPFSVTWEQLPAF